MASSHVLGIDFGTSNSYFCKCPGDVVQPSSIDFGTGRDGLATAILYRSGREPLVGNEALYEWGEATEEERRAYRLRTHFKPDIAAREEARTCAQDFFRAVVAQWERRHVDLSPAEREVIVGVPSEASEQFRAALAGVASEAGYGSVRMVDEPVAALLHHVQHKDLSPEEAHRGVLVVDFGGGTCDFAYMCRLEVRHSWGDMWLGGRLFDDLFFQWFLEQNPDAPDLLRAANADYFVHWHECRELKEFFSNTMARDRVEIVRKRLGSYGVLTDMTWRSFQERARQYRPTAEFMEHLREANCPVTELTHADGAVDLLGWFWHLLAEGLDTNGVRPSDIERVILAGGSSQWPFVADALCEVLHMEREEQGRILRSDRPYVAIGEGLAILPAVQRTFEQTRRTLRRELPGLFQDEINPLVEEAVENVLDLISQDITIELYDDRISGILHEYREQGGAITALRHRIERAAAEFEPGARAIVHERMSLLQKGLPARVQECVAAWLDRHNLHCSAEQTGMTVDEPPEVFGDMPIKAPDFYAAVGDCVGALLTVIVASVVGNVCGGAGTALILAGPLGWTVGAVIGAVTAGLALLYGRQFARRATENWNVPPEVTIPVVRKKIPVLKAFLTRRKLQRILEKGRRKFHEGITAALHEQLAGPLRQLETRIRDVVQRQIESLSAIDQL